MSYSDEELAAKIKEAVRAEMNRCLSQIDREKGIWHVNSCSRAVRTACENIKAMIRGERK
jgi:hypothetical protein